MTQPLMACGPHWHWIHVAHWGDVPTWLAFAAAAVATFFAFRQLRGQRDEIKRQVKQLERQQADQVDVVTGRSDGQPPGAPPPGSGFRFWKMVQVTNGSRRPIRGVACRLTTSDHVVHLTAQVQMLTGAAGPQWKEYPRSANGRAELIWSKASLGFTFALAADAERRDAQFTVRFTDDDDLHWEIDNDLRLIKLPNRSEW